MGSCMLRETLLIPVAELPDVRLRAASYDRQRRLVKLDVEPVDRTSTTI